MARRRHLRISVDDDASLQRVGSWRLTGGRILLLLAGFLLTSSAVGLLIVWGSPLKRILPGYLAQGQRAATEQTLLRLDSLRDISRQQEFYVRSLSRAYAGPPSAQADSLAAVGRRLMLTPDSLAGPSRKEREFVESMRGRDRYDLSVIAPLDAEGLTFYPLNEAAIFLTDTRSMLRASVVLGGDTPIGAVCDGTVIAVASSPKLRRYVVTIQHPNGFLSRVSDTGLPLVEEGDKIYGSQGVALPPPPAADGRRVVVLEMWHDGTPLLPYDYVETRRLTPHSSPKF